MAKALRCDACATFFMNDKELVHDVKTKPIEEWTKTDIDKLDVSFVNRKDIPDIIVGLQVKVFPGAPNSNTYKQFDLCVECKTKIMKVLYGENIYKLEEREA